MSSIIKHFICLLCIVCIVSCSNKQDFGGKVKTNVVLPKNNVWDDEQQLIQENSDNIYKQDVDQSISQDVIVNDVQYNPVDVVDGILKNPSKKLHIALIVPTTGKYASIGKTITESAILTLQKSKFDQIGEINVYNINNLNTHNWQENSEIQRLLRDNNDIFIGAGENFEDTTKKLLSILPTDKLFISFINNVELAKQYANLLVLGVDERYKVHSLLQYLKDYQRRFIALLLPATKKGYNAEKMFRQLAPYYDIFVVSSQFYQPKIRASIMAAIRGVSKNFTTTYMIDENGRFVTETYKQNKIRKNNNNLSTEDISMENIKTQTVNVNAVYIDAEENDLITMLNAMEITGLSNKNVQFISNAVIDVEHSIATKLDNVLYIGYNYNVIDDFNKSFKSYFNYSPNYFAYLTYDTLSMLFYVSSFWNMNPRYLYTDDGFRGLLDEFRLTREGNVERRMSVYRLRNQIMSRVFVPNDYINANMVMNNESLYLNNK